MFWDLRQCFEIYINDVGYFKKHDGRQQFTFCLSLQVAYVIALVCRFMALKR